MGNNQVKTTTSPMLPAESCALSCQDYQEKQIRKGIPRRVGSMILSHWILMKRRELAILEKARRAVSEGRAPAEILEKIERHVAKETKKYHIKYHPRVLARKAKPVRIRLKAPKLTNTAARRIQASFQRREKEQEEATKEAKRQTRSRISVKSHAWTDSGIPNDQRATQMNHLDRKRSLSVPPTSTLSLQSITTAESSSGIGMSRASSMTSVASSRSKNYYTRQRGRSLEEDEKLLEELRELQERHKMQKPIRGGSCNSIRRYLGETSGRHRCRTAQRYAQQQLELEQHSQQQQKKGKPRRNKVDDQLQEQQKNKQDTSEHKVRDERHKDQQTLQRQDNQQEQSLSCPKDEQRHLKKQMREHHSQVRKNKEQPSHRSENNKATSTREDGQQQQQSRYERDGNQDARKRRQNKKEKKDQASQTRMSGPPRPRRLLLARQLKKQPRTSQEHQEQEQLRVRFKHSDGVNPVDSSNSEPQKILSSSRGKSASGIVQSAMKQDLRSKPIKSREEDQHLKLPKGNSGQVSAEKRKKSYIDIDDLNIQGKQHERLQKQEPEGPRESHHQRTGRETNIRVNRLEVQLHRSIHGDEAQSQQHDTKQEQSDKHKYQQEQPSLNHSQLRRQSKSQQTDECGDMFAELSVDSQEQEQLNHKTKLTKQNLEIMKPQLSEFSLQAPVELTQESGVVKRLQDTECAVESRGGGRVGTLSRNDHPRGSLEHIHAVEAQSEGHLERSQERGIAVESEGGERRRRVSEREYNTESHVERRSRKSLDRRRLSASIEHLQTAATERALPETSSERGRRHQHTEHDSLERGHRQQLTDHVLNEQTIETVRREPLMESTHGGHFVERIRHDPLLERFRSEPSLHNIHELPTRYVHRARVVEYTRHEPMEHLRQDIRVSHEPLMTAGRTASPVHHRRTIYTQEGLRLSPESGRNTIRQRDHSYNSDTSELGYIRSYREHRYNGGFLDPIHTGAYSERTYTARSLEPNYRRLSLDNHQSRSVEPDYSRSFSERSYVRNSIDKYPERVLSESRWRSTDDWEDGERKRYREMITPINTLSPSLDHRAL